MAAAYSVSLGAATLAALFVGTLFAAAGRGSMEWSAAQLASPQGSYGAVASAATVGPGALVVGGGPMGPVLVAQSCCPAPARESDMRAGSRERHGLHLRDESRRSGRFGVGYEWRMRSRRQADSAVGYTGPGTTWDADSDKGSSGEAP